MVNDTGSIVEETFIWVQLAVHLSCTIFMVRIFATLVSIPDLTSRCRWIKRYYIAPNLCIPCFEISNIKRKLKGYDQSVSINFTRNWIHSKERTYTSDPRDPEGRRRKWSSYCNLLRKWWLHLLRKPRIRKWHVITPLSEARIKPPRHWLEWTLQCGRYAPCNHHEQEQDGEGEEHHWRSHLWEEWRDR